MAIIDILLNIDRCKNKLKRKIYERLISRPSSLRPMSRFILEYSQNSNLVGAEIGIRYGNNAKTMLIYLPLSQLYLIDSYEAYLDWDGSFFSQNIQDKTWRMAHKKLSKYKEKLIWIRKTSNQAVKDIKDNSLDFCYIDGNHEYKYVVEDMFNYWIKVRPGGILGGHDIAIRHIPGVAKALFEFLRQHNKCKWYIVGCDWWIIKEG
ncbi:class I SAM-dependent methyltransferase [Patescibacteria group bacterium]|nr:class I SAM-dependent methyltransferase [Patescibacteria group bacterium]